MKEHELKTWPAFFADLKSGRKTFELRKNDRNFQIGDRLILREYDPEKDCYTGKKLTRKVTHVLRYAPSFGLEVGYAILSIKPRDRYDEITEIMNDYNRDDQPKP